MLIHARGFYDGAVNTRSDYSTPIVTASLDQATTRPLSTQPDLDNIWSNALGAVLSHRAGIQRRICCTARSVPPGPEPDTSSKYRCQIWIATDEQIGLLLQRLFKSSMSRERDAMSP